MKSVKPYLYEDETCSWHFDTGHTIQVNYGMKEYSRPKEVLIKSINRLDTVIDAKQVGYIFSIPEPVLLLHKLGIIEARFPYTHGGGNSDFYKAIILPNGDCHIELEGYYNRETNFKILPMGLVKVFDNLYFINNRTNRCKNLTKSDDKMRGQCVSLSNDGYFCIQSDNYRTKTFGPDLKVICETNADERIEKLEASKNMFYNGQTLLRMQDGKFNQFAIPGLAPYSTMDIKWIESAKMYFVETCKMYDDQAERERRSEMLYFRMGTPVSQQAPLGRTEYYQCGLFDHNIYPLSIGPTRSESYYAQIDFVCGKYITKDILEHFRNSGHSTLRWMVGARERC